MTTYRDSCGTLPGLIDHQSAAEKPCGWCAAAEASARLAAEAITWRPAPADALSEPVGDVQARLNAAVLAIEVEAYERDHRPGSPRLSRPGARVSRAEAGRNRAVLAGAVRTARGEAA